MPCEQPTYRGFVAAQPQNPNQGRCYYPLWQHVIQDCSDCYTQQYAWCQQQNEVQVDQRLLLLQQAVLMQVCIWRDLMLTCMLVLLLHLLL